MSSAYTFYVIISCNRREHRPPPPTAGLCFLGSLSNLRCWSHVRMCACSHVTTRHKRFSRACANVLKLNTTRENTFTFSFYFFLVCRAARGDFCTFSWKMLYFAALSSAPYFFTIVALLVARECCDGGNDGDDICFIDTPRKRAHTQTQSICCCLFCYLKLFLIFALKLLFVWWSQFIILHTHSPPTLLCIRQGFITNFL